MSEYVLVARGVHQTSEVYHLPGEESPDRPKCDTHRPKETKFYRADREAYPNRRLCQQCSGEDYHNPHTGTQTATKLSRMDPDDVGGSA